MLGFAEQIEFVETVPDEALAPCGGRAGDRCHARRRRARDLRSLHRRSPRPTACPYWDEGAPGLASTGRLGAIADADPFNDHEPVDSSGGGDCARRGCCGSAASLARAGDRGRRRIATSRRDLRVPRHAVWRSASERGRCVIRDLLLHSIYHRPNGWDHVPAGSKIPRGESSQWGDYHAARSGALRQAASGRRRASATSTD